MKKLIIRLLIALVVLIIVAGLGVRLFLDAAIKRGVETFGPKLTKVDIKLQSVNLSLLSGSGSIKGLVVGNPEGFKEPSAIRVGYASLTLKSSSVFSDKIIIKSIKVEGPEITYETTLKTSNLKKILSNIEETTGGGQKEPAKPQEPAKPKEAKPAKKLQVDDFLIAGAKVHVSLTGLGGATVPLPDIHLQDLGTGPDGITPAELTKRVMQAITDGSVKAASGATADIGKGAVGVSSNAVQSVTKGIGGLFKKKTN
jgi:uncharacterized protein involved in outer membrane biogenesis